MNRSIHIINADGILKAFNQVQCGEVGFISNRDFEIPFSEIIPPENYSAPEGFPHCCEFHGSIFESLEAQIKRFPFCCASHSKLSTQKWFKKEGYNDVPSKILNALGYSEFQFETKINNDDWYEDITEYFDYCVQSIGQLPSDFGPPLGLHAYLKNLRFIIQHQINDPKYEPTKIIRLVLFLDKYLKPEKVAKGGEINILIGRYREWLKIFPFEISYLSHLKEHFEKQIPIIKGQISENRYMGLAKVNIVSYEELLDHLVRTTTLVLQTINGLSLFNQGKLKDIEAKQLELINANRKIELSELSSCLEKGKKHYIKLIKKWLKGEEAYLNKVAPILRNSLPDSIFIK